MKINRTIITIAFTILGMQTLYAQLPDSSTGKKKYWYHALRLRFPEFIVDRIFPFPVHSFSTLPYGMDKYMYPTLGDMGTIGFTNNYSFRFIGLFYKDRIGLELYRGGFGALVDHQPFNDYLQTKFPDHYNNVQYVEPNKYTFSGWQYGLAYKHHWKGWIIEPKFILGFEEMQSRDSYWIFKEAGSNQFTEYRVQYWDSSRHNNSYHVQLRLAKRFRMKKDGIWYELGLKTEYITSANNMLYLQVTEKPYGQPPIEDDMLLHYRFKSFTAGLFFTIYLKNGHIIN